MDNDFLVKNLIISDTSLDGFKSGNIYLRLKDNSYGNLLEIDQMDISVYLFHNIGGLIGNLKLDENGVLIEKEGERYE